MLLNHFNLLISKNNFFNIIILKLLKNNTKY